MSTNLEEMQRAWAIAYRAEVALKRKRDEERRAMIDKATKEIDEKLWAVYGADLERLAEERFSAEKARDQEKSRIALIGEGAPYPLGTVLHEWDPDPAFRFHREQPWIKTGRTGVVEAVTTENIRDIGKPIGYTKRAEPGDFAVRIRTKDGKPGKRYVVLCDWYGRNWYGRNWLPHGKNRNDIEREDEL